MSNAEIHQSEGFQWSIDNEGTLNIESSEGGCHNIHLEAITVEDSEWSEYHQDYVPVTRVIGYNHPWSNQRDLIRQLRIGDGINNIPSSAFAGLDRLETVELPGCLVGIGTRAFASCDRLREIKWREPSGEAPAKADWLPGMGIIGEQAFHSCKSLQSIVIPNGYFSILDYAFCWCENLRHVELPSSVSFIGGNAFSCCKNLTDIVLPEGLQNIGESAFFSCDSLKSISVPANVTKIGKDAFDRSALLEVVIPAAFKDNKDIFTVYRPDSMPRLVVRYAKAPRTSKPEAARHKSEKSLFSRLFGRKSQ